MPVALPPPRAHFQAFPVWRRALQVTNFAGRLSSADEQKRDDPSAAIIGRHHDGIELDEHFDGDRLMVVVKLTGPAMYLETAQPKQVLQGALHCGRECREHRLMNRKYRDLQRES